MLEYQRVLSPEYSLFGATDFTDFWAVKTRTSRNPDAVEQLNTEKAEQALVMKKKIENFVC
jgi:hypothetical protein